jgi:hypothetical protein
MEVPDGERGGRRRHYVQRRGIANQAEGTKLSIVIVRDGRTIQ